MNDRHVKVTLLRNFSTSVYFRFVVYLLDLTIMRVNREEHRKVHPIEKLV